MKRFDFVFLHPPRIFRTPWFRFKEKFLHSSRSRSLKDLGSPPQQAYMPMGLLSLASSLENAGYSTRVFNLALTQDINPFFEVSRYIKSLHSDVFAIDMHWFMHTASALETAYLCKHHHPNSLVILGGLNATHFNREIMQKYYCIDVILKGEADNSIVQLADSYTKHRNFNGVDGIVYRKGKGIEYRIPKPPKNIDLFDFTKLELVEQYRKYLKTDTTGYSANISNAFWLNIGRGCPFNCIHCGGGHKAYQKLTNRQSPIYRSPNVIADDIKQLGEYGVEVINLSHDPEIFGKKYWLTLFEELRKRAVETAIYIESFRLPSKEFVEELCRTFYNTTVALSPETMSEDIRRFIGRDFSNDCLFNSIRNLRKNGANVLVFLTVGLPGETLESLNQTKKFITKIATFGALPIPTIPYTIDPNCLMALYPEKYGVKLLLKHLEDYKRICSSSNPKDWIGHETRSLKKNEIFTALNDIYRYTNDLLTHLNLNNYPK